MLFLLFACTTEKVLDADTALAEEVADVDCVSEQPTINSTSGCVQGIAYQGLSMFLGIPYAEPPIGSLRWKRPVSISPWSEVKKADQLSSMCPQHDGYGGIVGSEDCLSINIFRPVEKDEVLPILFFTHGGSFVAGMGSSEVIEAPPELGKQAIVITHNYRLGPLGFLAHPALTQEDAQENGIGTSGNLGLLDTLMALQWVYDNAEVLGGSKDQIMIFGESAGGVSTCALLIMPESEGLFSSALIQSGACTSISNPISIAQEQGIAYENLLGCGTTEDGLSCMRDATVEELLRVDASTVLEFGNNFSPNVDEVYIPQASGNMLYAGDFHDVPIAAGVNANEGSMFVHSLGLDSKEELEETLREYASFWGLSDVDTLIALYTAEDFGDPQAAMDQFYGDVGFVCPTRLSLDMMSYYSPTYAYYYSHVPSWNSQYPELEGWGAYHSSELTFVFGTYLSYLTPEERLFSNHIMETWVNFARGAYETSFDSEWSLYGENMSAQTDGGRWLSLLPGDFEMIAGVRKERCDFIMSQWFE